MKQVKKIALTFLILLNLHAVKAQTVDEIVDKFIAAMGGKEKLMTLNSVRLEGTLNTPQGFDIPIVATVLNGKGARTDISIPGQSDGYRIFTPTKGWEYLPFQGMASAEESSEDLVQVQLSQLDLQSPLLNYAAKGHKVELLGKEKVDGAECFKMKITYKNGKSAVFFVDGTTYYRVKAVANVPVNGRDMEITTTYSDFKKTPEGYVFPRTQHTPSGVISYTLIEINKPVDENIFKPNN